ncbi:MAG: MoxR family ATPase [Xanthomonadales bacterium]|jgi:MoxR-like ATPase|nr:MoxR family ATPase [Xanthomonadales bacterium]
MSITANLSPGTITALSPQPPQFEQSYHQWSQIELDALTLAHAVRRPLLVRGEPGVGKTQIARAIAVVNGWMLHRVTIRPRFEAEHLIARLDPVKRLADAQRGNVQSDAYYWTPGPIWRAYDFRSAQTFMASARAELPETEADPAGHVILIDEIDKADSDLPNSLLELLGQRAFEFAPLGLHLGGPAARLPLVIITTNEERELPAAFVRRCVVLNLAANGDYEEWLVARGQAHFQSPTRSLDLRVLRAAAQQLLSDRRAMQDHGLSPPGAAEYLDLLTALHSLAPADTARQLELLRQLSAYVFVKHDELASPLKQDREPLSPPDA